MGWATAGQRTALASVGAAACVAVLVLTLVASSSPPRRREARPEVELPGWTSPKAVSSVYVVSGETPGECTVRGGRLGGPGACGTPSFALRHAGVDRLLEEMGDHGEPLERLLGGASVVVVAVDSRCGGRGEGAGWGRLSTSTDVVKGLVWRILQLPVGFHGEVVVAGESPSTAAGLATTPANAVDQEQSLADVVAAFSTLGYPVSLVDWRRVGERRISAAGPKNGVSPRGEVAGGDLEAGFVVLEEGGAVDVAYPELRTAGGRLVSLRQGVWTGGRFDSDRLRVVNVAALTADGSLGADASWANLARIAGAALPEPPVIGRWLAKVRRPDLNLLDATWVGDDSCDGSAVRRDVLLAGTDPFALDWYASELLLYPAVAYWQDASAARAGAFRDATRAAQKAAAEAWEGPGYPWIVFEEGGTEAPSRGEREQLDVHVAGDRGGLFEDGFETDGAGLWSEVVRPRG